MVGAHKLIILVTVDSEILFLTSSKETKLFQIRLNGCLAVAILLLSVKIAKKLFLKFSGTGPRRDRTTMTVYGTYAYFDTSEPRRKGDTAVFSILPHG